MIITPSGYSPNDASTVSGPSDTTPQPRDGTRGFDALLSASLARTVKAQASPAGVRVVCPIVFPPAPTMKETQGAESPAEAAIPAAGPSGAEAAVRAAEAGSAPQATPQAPAAQAMLQETAQAATQVLDVQAEPAALAAQAAFQAAGAKGQDAPGFTIKEEYLLRVVAGADARRTAVRSAALAASSAPRRPAARAIRPPLYPALHPQEAEEAGQAASPGLENLPGEVAAGVNATPSTLEKTALSMAGRRYVVGGENPRSGFDCSGFTSFVYAQNGVELPRNSREQYQEGTPVRRENLQPGDLVFFGSKNRVRHVGIYLEDGKFMHSSSSGGTVRIGSLDDPVWEKAYAGARRKL